MIIYGRHNRIVAKSLLEVFQRFRNDFLKEDDLKLLILDDRGHLLDARLQVLFIQPVDVPGQDAELVQNGAGHLSSLAGPGSVDEAFHVGRQLTWHEGQPF